MPVTMILSTYFPILFIYFELSIFLGSGQGREAEVILKF